MAAATGRELCARRDPASTPESVGCHSAALRSLGNSKGAGDGIRTRYPVFGKQGSTGSVATGEESRCGAEGRVRRSCLGRIVGRRVAAHHRRRGAAEEVLHVEFPGVVLIAQVAKVWRKRWGLAWTPARWPSRVKRVPMRYLFIGPRGFLGRAEGGHGVGQPFGRADRAGAAQRLAVGLERAGGALPPPRRRR